MKGFFLLLLLTNLLFIGWQLFAAAETSDLSLYRGVARVSQGLPLLSELDEANQPPLRKQTVEPPKPQPELIEPQVKQARIAIPVLDAQPGSLCYQSSLLTSLSEATALQRQLEKFGISKSERNTVETTKVNYWVKLPPYKSRAKANEAADTLKKNKIKDFFIVRSGRHENAISLGVFSTRERADNRYKAITGLKARLRKPVIEEMELPAKRLVVSFSVKSTSLPEGLSSYLDTDKQPSLKKIACKP